LATHQTSTASQQIISAWMPSEDVQAIQTLAAEGDRSVSAEIRRAIRRYIQENEKNPAQRTTGRGSKKRAGGRDHEQA
jgi:Ribbon-helix-helix protein, copG family